MVDYAFCIELGGVEIGWIVLKNDNKDDVIVRLSCDIYHFWSEIAYYFMTSLRMSLRNTVV